VPLDYADPAGPQITVGLARLPARRPAQRLGSLVFNPGGPGGSGGAFVVAEAMSGRVFTAAVRDRFDLIGLDPRGVGLSTPVRCDPDRFNQLVSAFPTDQAGFDALVAHNTALGESCLALTGPLLAHVDTVSAARDIEAVRLALGEGRLNYLGLSYGTQLGAQYAALYPDNIRVMALDGALDHTRSEITMLVDEGTAYEAAFDRFVAWCAQDASCALHGRDAAALFDHLVAQADQTPLPARACAAGTAPQPCRPTVRAEDLRLNAEEMLLFKPPIPGLGLPGWNGLAEALAQAAAGDASAFAPALASGPADNAYVSGPAIECLDFPAGSRDYDDLAARELLGRVVAPRMRGASGSWSAGCLGWPVPVANPPHPLAVRGAPPILIVNATHDPATAYPWAVGLLTQIEGSVLLTRDGDGHTSYLLPGPSRTRDAIDAYLLTGATPPPNAVYAD
jgi:pimeloyl-ACP methyl ester carboxylesterase